MTSEKIKHTTVVGAGLMGHGIALDFALAGIHSVIHSRSPASIQRGLDKVRSSADQLVELGKSTAVEADAAVDRITGEDKLDAAVAQADLVIESVYEDLSLKQEIFRELDELCPQHTILASNTSGFMPSSFTGDIRRSDKALVMHYINPPHLIPSVEVVPTVKTSCETIATVKRLLTRLGKRPIVLRKEVPGFVLSRLQMALLREACWLVENGVAEARDVDSALRNSLGRRWAVAGVFEILEIAGWDLLAKVASELLPHMAFSPKVPSVLKEIVEKGELGVKTSKGLYEWTPESVAELKSRIARALVELEKWS